MFGKTGSMPRGWKFAKCNNAMEHTSIQKDEGS
jgi:hypothetical protein